MTRHSLHATTSTASASHRLYILFSMATSPHFPRDSPKVTATSRTWDGTWVRAMGSANGTSGNRSCTLGLSRELRQLRGSGGEILLHCKYPHEMRLPGRAAVLALKGSTVSNRQQPSRPIDNS